MVFHWKAPLPSAASCSIDLFDHRLNVARVHVAGQFGLYASRMHGRCAHATLPMPLVESNGKEDVRRLRSAVGNEGLVGRSLKVGILEIDVGETVP